MRDRLLARLTGVAAPPAPPPARRSNPDAVVDCALYVDGRREPGRQYFVEAYQQARERRGGFVWLGLHDPGAAAMAAVGQAFGLHELTVAQALTDGHRPTLDRHGDVTLLVLRTAGYVEHAELTDTSEIVDTGDVMVLIGDRFVITVRHGAAGALTSVRTHLESRRTLLAEGPWSVAYAVCARMVDLYQEVAGQVEHDLDRLEETVFARDRGPDVQQVYQLKRELVEFKRAVLPALPRLRALTGEYRAEVPAGLRRYFADVDQRLARAADRVTAFDELVNSVMQARLAQVAIEQNNDMRKMASWAAIAAVQTVIAGIYGMNFAVMAGTQWRYGYPAILLFMGATGVTLHRRFRRSGWL